jgi:formylglycine-generating enzyme required for sulfatase activity
MNGKNIVAAAVAAVLLAAGAAEANVFDMGPGLTSLELVTVGNPGNAGELSGWGAGGYGSHRICGAVPYTYNIGKYEVTAGQYTEFLNAVAGVDTCALYNTTMSRTDYGSGITRSGGGTVGNPYTYSVATDYANRPVNYVSWGDSARFANWLHNGQPTGPQVLSTTEDGAYYLNGATSDSALQAVSRKANWKWAVTSEDEWYKAAYYKGSGTNAGYWDYPTSSDTASGQDMADASGNNANYYTTSDLLGSPYYRTEVGEFQNSASPYGTFDQGGNVWEWNEAILYGDCRGLRGGSFRSYDGPLQAAGRYDRYYPANEDGNIGFRVSQVPEPATLSLLALGACLPLLRRKHPPALGRRMAGVGRVLPLVRKRRRGPPRRGVF